jgi:hypothetical protein
MAFPTNPVDGEYYKNSSSDVFKYIASDNRWQIVREISEEIKNIASYDFRIYKETATQDLYKISRTSSDNPIQYHIGERDFYEEFTSSAGQTTFTLTEGTIPDDGDGIPDSGSVMVYDNGSLVAIFYKGSDLYSTEGTLEWGTDIDVASSGTEIVFAVGRDDGDTIRVEYYPSGYREDDGVSTYCDFENITDGKIISIKTVGEGTSGFYLQSNSGNLELFDATDAQIGSSISFDPNFKQRVQLHIITDDTSDSYEITVILNETEVFTETETIIKTNFIDDIYFFETGEYTVGDAIVRFNKDKSLYHLASTREEINRVSDTNLARAVGDNQDGYVGYNGNNIKQGWFYSGTTAPSNSNRLNYDGYFYATRVYNAVYNDIADFITIEEDCEVEYGKVYVFDGEKHRQSASYMEIGAIGICTDTYGFGVGSKKDGMKQIPIAIGGFVLAYVDKEYPSGTPLTTTGNGYLTEITQVDKMEYPERVVATFYKTENNEYWNEVPVKGRMWVRVR